MYRAALCRAASCDCRKPLLKGGAGAPGVSNSVHGRAERTQCSRRPARSSSQASCQHRSHWTASSLGTHAAARLAIRIEINDRSFVERSHYPRDCNARRTPRLGTTLARVASQVHALDKWIIAMPTHRTHPQDEVAVESPIADASRNRRTSIEAPVDTDVAGDVERDVPEAHTPRPHPPVEEPEEKPDEHIPETEPDSEPDADSDQRRRPPRPGKAPR
jgi:hypothetical protein